MTLLSKLISVLTAFLFVGSTSDFENNSKGYLLIPKSDDFIITGTGLNSQWTKSKWVNIPILHSKLTSYQTKAKALYSDTGIYFLFYCEDHKITATMEQDFLDLWNEDVIEIFLQPNQKIPAYFEYELSPLNYELPITIFNENGQLNSWIPFHAEEDRKTSHLVSVQGGEQKSQASISSWTSELFIPFVLLKPILDSFPVSGTKWRGNLNRIDYDHGETLWSWQKNSGDFHEYKQFGIFEFE